MALGTKDLRSGRPIPRQYGLHVATGTDRWDYKTIVRDIVGLVR